MIGRLEANPVGKALAGVSAALTVILLLLGAIWALPPSGSDDPAGEAAGAPGSEVPQLAAAEPIENYAEISNRPVFNPDRQPVIGGDEQEDGQPDEPVDNVDAPDVQLAGVVITPELRVATLRLKDSPDSLLALEGQPLEGDFGSWHLSRIEPRAAILESGSGEQVRLELQIHDVTMEEPPEKVARRQEEQQAAAEAAAEPDDDGAPITRAEEIRQRIAERREELRRAAEEGGQAQQAPPGNYRQAIQAMMAKGQNKDDEQN